MIGEIKVISVNGRNFPISEKLFKILSADGEIEGEISKVIADAISKTKVKIGKKK